MTLINAVQKASTVIGLAVPNALAGSSEREHVELLDVANTVLKDILKAHEWELLRTVATINGDGSTTEFALPADYDRMLKKGNLWSSRIQTPYRHILDLDEWLEIETRSYEFVVGVWTKYGGEIKVKPAPASGETIQYFYVSNLAVTPSSGADKTAFEADDDVIRVGDDELLKRGIVWRWRQNKGIPYAEDMADFEEYLADLVGDDKGPKILRGGRRRFQKGANLAYPTVITP